MPTREIVLFRWSAADIAAEPVGEIDGFEASRWTSALIHPGFAATELIPSWTAATPGATFIRIELRAVNEAGRHTGWYRLGDWAADDTDCVRTTVRGQDDEDATVNADVLVAAPGRAMREVQARVTLLRPAGSQWWPTVRSLHLLASATPAESEPSTPRAALGRVLAVPGFSQLVHEGGQAWCSAASTAMVLSYWGAGPPSVSNPDDLVPYTARHVYDPGFGGCGNWPFNTAYAGRFGLRAFVTRLRSLNEAELFLDAGIPLVVAAAYARGEVPGLDYDTEGHLSVLTGFTADGDPVLNDPNSPTNAEVRKTVGRRQWEAAWLRSSRGVAYVICPETMALPPAVAQPNW